MKALVDNRLATFLPRILPYLRPYGGLAVLTAVLYGATTVFALLEPWPLKILIDSAFQGQPLPGALSPIAGWVTGPMAILLFAVGASLATAFLQNATTVLSSYAHTRLEQNMALDFRADLFKHVQRLSMAYHDQRRSGMLIYVINGIGASAPALAMTVLPLAQNVLTLVGMFWVTFHLDRTLALVSLLVVPFLYYSVGYYTRHIQGSLYAVRNMEAEALSIIHEAISMLRVIVAFGRERHEHRRFRAQGAAAVDARVRLTVRQTLFSLVVNTTTALGTAVILGLGGYHVMLGRLTIGELLVVIAYVAAVYAPLRAISATIGGLQDQFVNLEMAFGLLDTMPDIRDTPGASEAGRIRGRVTFERVDFSYQTRTDTLRDVSFEASAGDVIAIVGPTGAGKTTLASLLPRFYDVSGGAIRLDGVDIRELTLDSLRAQIAFVLQEPLLFSTTIAENIRYGRLDASDADVAAAAKAANAHDFIVALPDGYQTLVGERGAQLSGGERQRISVARAFLKDAPLLILDEPTSAIDSRTELVILDALDRLMKGRTTFLIAHRLSTIRSADQILVLNHGQLVQRGTHDELLSVPGLYRELYDVQVGDADQRIAV
jgi:ATP-binding cassette subfamily B protein